MKKLLTLLLFPMLSFGQTDSIIQANLIETTMDRYYDTYQASLIETLIESGEIDNLALRGRLHAHLAEHYISEFDQFRLDNKPEEGIFDDGVYCDQKDDLLYNFLFHIGEAINLCPKCEVTFRKSRFDVLKYIHHSNIFHPLFGECIEFENSKSHNFIASNIDISTLAVEEKGRFGIAVEIFDYSLIDDAFIKEKGFKEDVRGMSIGINYLLNEENKWLGLDISLASIFQPKQKIYSDVTYTTLPFTAELLTFGYATTINRDEAINDFSLSLVSYPMLFEAPFIKIRPLNFGIRNQNDDNVWYYSPEIGLCYGSFSVNYAYNINFKKDVEWLGENKHYVNIRFSKQIFSYDN